jgi:ubiquinol-cytochrome c reductase cytochrome c subunit
MRRRVLAALALLAAAGALWLWASPAPPARAQSAGPSAAQGLVQQGRALYLAGCSSCHGTDARGIRGRAPTLYGAGAAAADWYLRTGRMPLAEPSIEPVRNNEAEYTPAKRRALVAYVGSLGGPAIPDVDPARGDLDRGFKAFSDLCAGCHTITGQGGVVPGGVAPSQQQASAVEIAEAIRVGPYLMPAFPERQVDQQTLDDLTAYTLSTRDLPDKGGWGIGNIGPIPEGLVAWMLGITALLITARLIGERT